MGAILLLLVALGLGSAGCGGGDDSSGSREKAKAAVPSPTPTEGPRTKAQKPSKRVTDSTPGPDGEQTDVLSNLPGSTEPGCVVVGGKARDVRSGDMAAGPFVTARKEYKPGNAKKRLVNLYFIPKHTEDLKAITVHGRNANGGGEFTQGSQNVGDAEQFRYFQLSIKLPGPGRWTISASTGQDNGCWVVELS